MLSWRHLCQVTAMRLSHLWTWELPQVQGSQAHYGVQMRATFLKINLVLCATGFWPANDSSEKLSLVGMKTRKAAFFIIMNN